MDVTLVLTHRCNLGCHYCYAGEHFRREMDEETLERAVSLLFCDGAEKAQLSFFGGEPFLAFDAMRAAVTRARAEAERLGRTLLIQCTSNGSVLGAEQVALVRDSGMKVTISLDGVREAHDITRPRAGGASSFDSCFAGLRALLAAGVQPDVLMVITPATVPYVARSVVWLWEQGVRVVRANLDLAGPWDLINRAEVRHQLELVADELVARRLAGETSRFQPIEEGMRQARAVEATPEEERGDPSPVRCGAPGFRHRPAVVVATGGNLYPCSPMVGEDRDEGPEARLRIGRVEDEAHTIIGSVVRQGAGCGDGRECACANYLETGNRMTSGPNARWFARVTSQVGWRAAVALRAARDRAVTRILPRSQVSPELAAAFAAGVGLSGGNGLPERSGDEPAHRFGRREALWLLATGTASVTAVGTLGTLLFATQGEMAVPDCPDPGDGFDGEEVPTPGAVMPTEPEPVPEPEPEPEPEEDWEVDGDMAIPDEDDVEPEPEPEPEDEDEPRIRGRMAPPAGWRDDIKDVH